MDIYDAIYGRRCVRRYDEGKDVSRDVIEKLLAAAVRAPSAGNAQPWRFIVVTDARLKNQLSDAALRQTFVASAPVVIVVCADLDIAQRAYGTRGRDLYCIQDTAAATLSLMLAAHAEGLGACWVGAFNEGATAAVLQLPGHLRPVVMVPIGYPAATPRERPRNDISQVTEWR